MSRVETAHGQEPERRAWTGRARRVAAAAIGAVACAALLAPAASAWHRPPWSTTPPPVTTPAPPTAASACPARTLVTPFAPWGDSNQYFLLANGGFESGSSSWTLTGSAGVVSGNETAYLNSRSDRSSLRLAAGASAASSAHCFQVDDQTVRLMVKGPGKPGAQLKVDAYVETRLANGSVNIRTVSTQILDQGASWAPSQPVVFSLGQSQMLAPTATVKFTFTALGGTWQIDDVYVDPFRSR